MKHILIAVLVLLGVSSVSAQGYPVGCTAGVINIVIGGELKQSNGECVYITRFSEAGYLPTLTQVSFKYGNNTYNGVIAGQQHTKKVDGSETVEYMVVYVGEIGPLFAIKEVAIAVGDVTPI